MKKLSVLLIAILFCVLSAGSSLADEPSTLDRHAVWSKWGDDDNHILESTGAMDSSRGTTRRVSTEAVEDEMREKTVEFDFIRETQSYDYAKDQNKSG